MCKHIPRIPHPTNRDINISKFGDLKRYCDKNSWVMIRNSDHWYYEKVLNIQLKKF
ncbi:hypothetical protein DOT_5272 [Desulfosporosinus sp. OT]|nr:hypothetical protein DOT_5272 [Desulfosporosinus sp. OT]